MIFRSCLFQGFQLTALVVRGPSELHPIFTVSPDGVAIHHEKVSGAVSCVQTFVHHPLFTQRNFFTETAIGRFNTAIAIRHRSEIEPWRAIGVEAGPVIADPKSCREKVVRRRKTIRDTRKCWFGVNTVASSTVGKVAPDDCPCFWCC